MKNMVLLSKLFFSDQFVLTLLIPTFILDAGNGLFPLIHLRGISFILVLLKLISYFFKGVRDKNIIIFIILSIIIPFYGSIVGLINGNKIGFIIGDANGYVFLLTGLGLSFITFSNPSTKLFIKKLVVLCGLILSVLTILIFLFYMFGIDIYSSAYYLKKYNLGFAGIEVNGEVRIFLRGFIYVVLATFFLLSGLLNHEYIFDRRKDKLSVFIMMITLLLSNTRGIWVSFFIGASIIFTLFNGFGYLKGKAKLFYSFAVKRKLLSIFILLLVITGITFFFGSYIVNTFERITSIFDFSQANESNSIRKEQAVKLIAEFFNHPIFGKGFGGTLESGYVRSVSEPYSFELSYLELLYKLGIVGFSIFVMGLVLFFRAILNLNDKKMNITLFAAGISLLFISITNPYIVSSLGIFYLSLIYAFTNTAYKHT
ncbi:O-antigen ligase family protein [Tepidibacillus marianensis]|uniref:O-antigen ligase family protein n=1 Tax=Tepidibacillus marianensis TaxID=3131995 RepID=UPI0030CFF6B7